MIRHLLTRAALADIDRFSDFLRESDPDAAANTLDVILNALEVLRRHPLYAFYPATNELLVAKLRRQLEAGYLAE